ncbi:hypothetical protein H6501_02230 [Candidatus Woesearchaeota archaeon]|nr:hypothetical protein [Candidatus Woesearchaeota archaeon]
MIMGNWLKPAALIGGLAAWYIATGDVNPNDVSKSYPIPEQIEVISAEYVDKKGNDIELEAPKKNGETLEKLILDTSQIDFSEDFEIKTDRYRIVKDDDWLPSRLVGHTLSLPTKLFFWDWEVSWRVDEKRAQAALSMLETNKDIKDLTVRLNHNEAFYDIYRLFADDKVADRNNFLARATLGVLTGLFDEVKAEFFRGDYYNPMSQTVVVYSNVESIAAHEIGHHKDYQRFDSDWEYALTGFFPPVTLYKEAKASLYAKDMLGEGDDYQFARHLLPAFFTYLLGTYAVTRRFLKKITKEDEIPTEATASAFAWSNAMLWGGIGGYEVAQTLGANTLVSEAGFVGGFTAAALLGGRYVIKKVGGNI